MLIYFKKVFRRAYYFFFNNRLVNLTKPKILSGIKWKINKNYGRAYFEGYYEPEIVQIITNYLKRDSIFFDIGAHAGYFSLIATQIAKVGQIISFEPMPRNYEFINEIKDINKINNWDVYNYAVSNFIGESGFLFGKTSSTGKIVSEEEGQIKIPTITIDRFIKDHGIYPDFIKIDVEGHGDKVFEGFSLLKEYPKKINLLLEIHQGTKELVYIQDHFLNDNFQIMDLNENILRHFSGKMYTHVLISNKDD